MTNSTIEDLRRRSLGIAEAIAPTWERRRESVEEVAAPVREWMIRELAPRPGDTLLELAAGAGDTGFEAARLVGEEGRLITTDFSPAMLDAARRRGGELGVTNVEYRVVDAERIDLENDSVDGVLCRFGYMLMVDLPAALVETRRVLRPGGRLALAVWGAPERNPLFTVVARTLVERGHMPPPEESEGPNPFSMASEERTRTLVEQAGFGTVRTEEIPVRFAVRDIDEYMSITIDTAGPFAMVLRGLRGDEREAIEAHVEAAFAPFVSRGGYEIPGVALAAAAS
jgi:SAM-dependent methyltransferase